jgi:hypothetical protein
MKHFQPRTLETGDPMGDIVRSERRWLDERSYSKLVKSFVVGWRR